MDAVLGLSMTPTTVGLVLVEGLDANGATVGHQEFDVKVRGGSARVAAAVLRTRATAAHDGHRLHSIGVTWTDDANAQAAMLMESLTESGVDNLCPVRLPMAGEALARGVGPAIGYAKTGVCVFGSDAVTALMVDARDDSVRSVISHDVDSDEAIISWLTDIVGHDGWEPEGVVVVGAGQAVAAITPPLQDALAIPVFAPAAPELAMARGAALAASEPADFSLAGFDSAGDGAPTRLSPGHVGALTMLIASVLTFVVSVSAAISLQLLPEREVAPVRRGVANTANTAAHPTADTVAPPAVAPAQPIAAEPILPEAAEPILPEPVTPEAPPPQPVEVALPIQAVPPADAAPGEQPAAAPPPVIVPEQVPAVPPARQPGILRRVLDRLRGEGAQNQPPAPVPLGPDSTFPPPGNTASP